MISGQVLHVMGCVHPHVGGPAYSVPRLAFHSGLLGFQASIYSFRYPFDDSAIPIESVQKRQAPFGIFSRRLGSWNPAGRKDLLRFSKEFQIIHTHGLWLSANAYAASAAKKNGKVFLVSPRGMLDPWTLQQKFLLKKILWHTWQKRMLEQAGCIHVTSLLEMEQVKSPGACSSDGAGEKPWYYESHRRHSQWI